MSKPKKKKLAIEEIRLDGDTQPRAELDQAIVGDYADAMLGGAKFPPLEVFFDGANYWLVDGFHRRFAAERAELDTVDCQVIDGTLEEAQWYSYARNSDHGLRRSNADKKKAVLRALKHPKGAEMSDSAIAEHCGVNDKTVAKYRGELESTSEIPKLEKRKGKDGKSRKSPSEASEKKSAADAVPKEVPAYECDGKCFECTENCDDRTEPFVDEDGEEVASGQCLVASEEGDEPITNDPPTDNCQLTTDNSDPNDRTPFYQELYNTADRLMSMLETEGSDTGQEAMTKIYMTMEKFWKAHPEIALVDEPS